MKRIGLLAVLAMAGCFSATGDGSSSTSASSSATTAGSTSASSTTGSSGTTGCAAPYGACTADADCCSGNGMHGYCYNGQCGMGEMDGAIATSNGGSGVSSTTGTSGLSTTGTSGTGSSTSSGCGIIGTLCDVDSDCCSGMFCSLGQCAWEGGTATGTTTGGCSGVDAACSSDADCCSGACDQGACIVGGVTASSTGTGTTTASGTTTGNCISTGQACGSNQACCSGSFCQAGVCEAGTGRLSYRWLKRPQEGPLHGRPHRLAPAGQSCCQN